MRHSGATRNVIPKPAISGIAFASTFPSNWCILHKTKTESDMRVGVPKEIKNHEYRVGLTPPSVAELVAAGHTVAVQTGAGLGIDF